MRKKVLFALFVIFATLFLPFSSAKATITGI